MTQKSKKKARGRPPKQEIEPIAASFEEVLQSVVRTLTPEELEAMLEDEKKLRSRDSQ